MDVQEVYEDQRRPERHLRWTKWDGTPYNFENGWQFRIELINEADQVVRTKVVGFTGGTGGTKRDTQLSNLVFVWNEGDLDDLGSVEGELYGLRIGAKAEGEEWMFFGSDSSRPVILVKRRPPVAP